jgi:hypothetical protein
MTGISSEEAMHGGSGPRLPLLDPPLCRDVEPYLTPQTISAIVVFNNYSHVVVGSSRGGNLCFMVLGEFIVISILDTMFFVWRHHLQKRGSDVPLS